MEGLSSSGQQRGDVDGKHEKGSGDVRGTQAGRGLASSVNSSSSSRLGDVCRTVVQPPPSLPLPPKVSAWRAGWWSLGGISTQDQRSPHSRLAIAVAETGACESGKAGLGRRGPWRVID